LTGGLSLLFSLFGEGHLPVRDRRRIKRFLNIAAGLPVADQNDAFGASDVVVGFEFFIL
jgi:hypothetical protein